ncbi:MAG: tRNA guanosine(15) transglycosylase TgtA [Candidatus Thalassarchaeaceae archaeon]|nr:tRNA guanosine(15) transglycosylase TgtA [Candidatus Thalassarchaeaceae archaeon]
MTGHLGRVANPSREGDHGKFEVKSSDGWARLGLLHTSTHMLATPTLLPVVNPNIQTISPREMWDIGFEALITNSYIIWKGEELKARALSEGVHELLDYPGLVMTDSGVFQQYVYGDVEIGEVEVVEFQRDIGVDIATMMDVFGRPDMTNEELSGAVNETVSRGPAALEAAKDTLLNGPIQGGTNLELRTQSATMMSEMDFAVHPIGGIVPLMENQRYTDLIKIIVASKSALTPERPVHLFGCGHPILFPICVALGIDLFDSAAYALFAKDDRMLTPTGTVKLAELNEWPHLSPTLWGKTPEGVRQLAKEERVELLARHNLQVTVAELARCREAVRNDTIWNLVEERSHANAELRAATLWLYDNMPDDLIHNSPPCRQGGVKFSSELEKQPRIINANQWLGEWKMPPVDHLGNAIEPSDRVMVILFGKRGPWRETVGPLVADMVRNWPQIMPIIYTPIALIPYHLEDLNPFAHLMAPIRYWKGDNFRDYPEGTISFNVEDCEDDFFGELEMRLGEKKPDNEGTKQDVKHHHQLYAICDKIHLFTGLSCDVVHSIANRLSFVMSRTGRVNNILLDGVHIFSQRLTDGGLSITNEGAKWIHQVMVGDGDVPCVIIDSNAEPFIRDGRNVMHGFILGCKGTPRNGMPCLLVNEAGELVGHGIAQCGTREMIAFSKGIAVKVRGGINPAGD